MRGGVIFVTEPPRGSAAAQEFQAGTSGAFSSLQNRSGAVPALRYDNTNANGVNYVKFDGYESSADGSKLLLIDAKTKLAMWSNPVKDDLNDTLRRVTRALDQNPGFKVVYEFPNQKTASEAREYLNQNDFRSIATRVRSE